MFHQTIKHMDQKRCNHLCTFCKLYIIILPDVIIYVLLRPYFFPFPFIPILKTCKVRGTELIFMLLVHSADPADRRCDRQTDRQTDRHSQGALGPLVLNKTKLGIITYLISGTKFPNLGGYRVLFDQGVLRIMQHKRVVRT